MSFRERIYAFMESVKTFIMVCVFLGDYFKGDLHWASHVRTSFVDLGSKFMVTAASRSPHFFFLSVFLFSVLV